MRLRIGRAVPLIPTADLTPLVPHDIEWFDALAGYMPPGTDAEDAALALLDRPSALERQGPYNTRRHALDALRATVEIP